MNSSQNPRAPNTKVQQAGYLLCGTDRSGAVILADLPSPAWGGLAVVIRGVAASTTENE
jgi:hypothetical protein